LAATADSSSPSVATHSHEWNDIVILIPLAAIVASQSVFPVGINLPGNGHVSVRRHERVSVSAKPNCHAVGDVHVAEVKNAERHGPASSHETAHRDSSAIDERDSAVERQVLNRMKRAQRAVARERRAMLPQP
jgi:hypothetical protein